MTSDAWALRTVFEGYRFEFNAPPPLFGVRRTKVPRDPAEAKALLS